MCNTVAIASTTWHRKAEYQSYLTAFFFLWSWLVQIQNLLETIWLKPLNLVPQFGCEFLLGSLRPLAVFTRNSMNKGIVVLSEQLRTHRVAVWHFYVSDSYFSFCSREFSKFLPLHIIIVLAKTPYYPLKWVYFSIIFQNACSVCLSLGRSFAASVIFWSRSQSVQCYCCGRSTRTTHSRRFSFGRVTWFVASARRSQVGFDVGHHKYQVLSPGL